jgi:hypothetical protein
LLMFMLHPSHLYLLKNTKNETGNIPDH